MGYKDVTGTWLAAKLNKLDCNDPLRRTVMKALKNLLKPKQQM